MIANSKELLTILKQQTVVCIWSIQ